MNFGIMDLEMTCDGRQEGENFIDDGRMEHSQREIISVGFVVVNEKYAVKKTYHSFVKPVLDAQLTEYCKNLTGIAQEKVDGGKKCNATFKDIFEICNEHAVKIILTFGNADKFGIFNSARFCKKAKQPVRHMFIIAAKILDVRPIILAAVHKKNIGLLKIAEILNLENNFKKHDALSDSLLLRRICKRLHLKISQKECQSCTKNFCD